MRQRYGHAMVALLLSLALMDSIQAVAETGQAGVSQAGPSDELQAPLYTLPKKFSPRARVGGELRGTEGSDPEVQALVPDHVGLTVKQTPVLNWFLSKPTAYTVRFTLIDNRSVKPLYEAPLPPPKKAGIQTIDLKEVGVVLEPDVQYRWYVSLVRNPDSPSQDIVAGGIIERCEFAECLVVPGVNLTCAVQSVIDNAQAGLWYDAMACLCNLIDAGPTDIRLRKLRAALLRQVGLSGVADWDLRSIQTLSH
jgi:hypothetical protein